MARRRMVGGEVGHRGAPLNDAKYLVMAGGRRGPIAAMRATVSAAMRATVSAAMRGEALVDEGARAIGAFGAPARLQVQVDARVAERAAAAAAGGDRLVDLDGFEFGHG